MRKPGKLRVEKVSAQLTIPVTNSLTKLYFHVDVDVNVNFFCGPPCRPPCLPPCRPPCPTPRPPCWPPQCHLDAFKSTKIWQDEYGLTDSHSLIGIFWRTSVATAPLEIFCRKGRYCLNIGKLPQEIKGGRQVFIWRILQSSYLMRVHCALCTQKAIWDSSNFFRCGPSQSCRLKT